VILLLIGTLLPTEKKLPFDHEAYVFSALLQQMFASNQDRYNLIEFDGVSRKLHIIKPEGWFV